VLLVPTVFLAPEGPAAVAVLLAFLGSVAFARRFDEPRPLIVFNVVLGLCATAVIITDVVARDQPRVSYVYPLSSSWEDSDGVAIGLFALIAALAFSAAAWACLRVCGGRAIPSDRLTCGECGFDLLGHDTGRCPGCGTDISFDRLTLTPVEFHRLARMVRQAARGGRPLSRFRRWYWVLAALGAMGTSVMLLRLPRAEPEVSVRRVEDLDDFELTEHHTTGELGWPMAWFAYYRTTWTATRAGRPVPVEDAELLARIERYEEYWDRANRKGVMFRLVAMFVEKDFSTFPGTHAWWVIWKGLYGTVLLVVAVWFSPILIVFLRNAVVHLSDLRRTIGERGAGHCCYCDYDLRGSLEARRCSECGTPFSLHVIGLGRSVAPGGPDPPCWP
jgi:hypothetical protein